MKRLIPALVAILLFCSHDMYLKLDSYFLSPEQSASIVLINGTWAESEIRQKDFDADLGRRH